MVPFSIEILDVIIRHALDEDVQGGDVTTEATIPRASRASAVFLAKETGILAGLFVAERVFHHVDPEVRIVWNQHDGDKIEAGTVFGHVSGDAHALLIGERTALNMLQRMSGIATATRRMVDATGPHSARILDTRKTVPGLRYLDKWAVHLGGGVNHRMGLYDMILIKDNHITAAGGVEPAIRAAQAHRKTINQPDLEIEVEARTLEEVATVLEVWQQAGGGVDRILLDNMVHNRPDGQVDTSMLEEAVALIRGRIHTEASGNVTLHTVPAIAATGVDYISSGALTHSVRAFDISMKVRLDELYP